MNKEAEQDELLADVLADGTHFRATTLELGLAEMQRVRKRRRAARLGAVVCAPLLVLATAIFLREFLARHTNNPPRVVQVGKVIPGTSIRVLSDEELLAMFKDRPVALVGKPGNQRLLLLDEAIQ